jgi:hypothetical protein
MTLTNRQLNRPMRFPLRSHDQLFFLHVPKTAGTTLVDILVKHFPKDRIVSYGLDETGPFSVNKNEVDVREHFKKALFIRAHEGYDFIQYLYHPVVITFLRHPYKRTISAYLHMQRHNPDRILVQAKQARPERGETEPVGFLEYLKLSHSMNRMVAMIGGFTRKEMLRLDGQMMLEVAKSHLDSIPFFGLTERFDESLDLMNYIFNWKPVDYQKLNTSPEGQKLEITPETQQALEECNILDMQLYEFAQTLFARRLEQVRLEQQR